MVEFFQTSKGIDLEQLTSATLTKLEEIKERTATGKFMCVKWIFTYISKGSRGLSVANFFWGGGFV